MKRRDFLKGLATAIAAAPAVAKAIQEAPEPKPVKTKLQDHAVKKSDIHISGGGQEETGRGQYINLNKPRTYDMYLRREGGKRCEFAVSGKTWVVNGHYDLVERDGKMYIPGVPEPLVFLGTYTTTDRHYNDIIRGYNQKHLGLEF